MHVITGLQNGGAEATLYRLITGDTANFHTVISLTDAGVYGRPLVDAGITLHLLNMPRGSVTMKGIRALYRLLRNIEYDVVQTWMYHADFIGGLVGRFTGCKALVWGVRNNSLDPNKVPWGTRIVAKLCGRLSRWIPRKTVFCSRQSVGYHVQMGYDKKKMAIIPNGYDCKRFSPDPVARDRMRTAWGIDARAVLIGMVARWDPMKDHENLIMSLVQLESRTPANWKCVLAGTNMIWSNQELVGLLKRYDMAERVLLIGETNDVPAIMNAIDLHVLSSSSEAFPNVVAEAMACCTPCVVTNVGDASLIVGETGWIVPPADPAALSDAILNAIMEMAEASQWSARQVRARERIEHQYAIAQTVQAYRAVWREVAEIGHG